MDTQEIEHLLHIDERLLDLTVDKAEEVERHVELDEEGVHEHEVAERHGARVNPLRGQDHDDDQPGRDDDALADVE